MQTRLLTQPRSILLAASAALALVTGTTAARPADGAAGPACRGAVDTGVLPVWARGGFSSPAPRMPHIVGRSGAIAALVFGNPLQSPPARTRGNKILWVARVEPRALSALYIRAQRMSGTTPVGTPVSRRIAGGPGPSLLDLPAAGCWRLALTWSGRTDSLDLRYR